MTVARNSFAVPALLLAFSSAGMAAESYDNCTGFIDSIPTTISTQGVWCLRKDLSTGVTDGIAIYVDANNVTIDCNDFKVGGLAGGLATNAGGIYTAFERNNATIRNCNVRGFMVGISVDGDGHLVENNRVANNTLQGISTYGDGNIVRNNMVIDTGGRPDGASALGIGMIGEGGEVSSNTVNGVSAGTSLAGGGSAGIIARGLIAGNHVSSILPAGDPAQAEGIRTGVLNSAVRDNVVIQHFYTAGIGITGTGTNRTVCLNNIVQNYATGIVNCDSHGDVVHLGEP